MQKKIKQFLLDIPARPIVKSKKKVHTQICLIFIHSENLIKTKYFM